MSLPTRVLIVDDERNALMALAKILREDGCQVVVASNEEQALERLSISMFDLIITDLFLLRSCCTKLFDKIQTLKQRTPVVLTTAHGDVNRYLDESSLAGVHRLSKPINYEELRRIIGQIELRDKRVSCSERDSTVPEESE